MLQFFQHIIAKIILAVSGFIIAVGLIQAPPAVEYKSPPKTLPAGATREIIPPETSKNEVKPSLPQPKATATSAPNQKTPASKLPEMPTAPAISLTELNSQVRKTIVNIICTTKGGGSFNPITGSGVIVSPKGVILTNAHIGQYFLLEGSPEAGYLDCVIRNGDIAQPAYDAKIIYIPSVWVEENAANIIQQEPKGTGKNDYSFLLIDKSIVAGQNLPQTFSSTEPNFDFNILPINFSVFLASYPAGFIEGIEIQKNLGLTSTFAQVSNLYTFATTGPSTLDIFSLGGNIVAQGGSSGGAVVDTRDGKLLGIITTSSEATTTAGRVLNAITLPHIKRSFETYANKPLVWFLEDPAAYDLLPAAELNRLKQLLIDQLEKK